MKISRLVIALLVAAAAFAIACDDDAPSPLDDRTPLTLEAYALQMDEIQVNAVRDEEMKVAALGETEIRSSDGLSETERAYLRSFGEVRAASLTAYVASLDALRAPDAIQGAHNAYTNAVEARAEFLSERAALADEVDTAAELIDGQEEIDARLFRTCIALSELVVAAGFPAFGLNCPLR